MGALGLRLGPLGSDWSLKAEAGDFGQGLEPCGLD